ncbi:MAG: hypothetical protein M3R09_07605 [Actinomycetota bacterium]|nr:hypothetical protein [Actinomycetota bacterium]
MNDPVPPIEVAGILLVATLITIAVNPIVSLLVLGRFRRAVARSMRTSTRPSTSRPAALPPPPHYAAETVCSGQPRLDVLGAGGAQRTSSHRGSLTTLAIGQVRQAIGWYVAAGVAYAVTAAVGLITLVGGEELLPLRTATVAFVNVWPLVPTLALVAAFNRRTTALAVSVYAATLITLGALGEAGVAQVLALWAILALPASLILAGVAGRRLRAVGPFLAPSVFVIGAGIMVWPWIAWPIVSAGASTETALLLAIGAVVVVAAVAFLNLPAAAWRYQRKAASDQSILVDQWWLLFSLYQCLQASSRGWAALALLLPYGAYRATVHVGRRRRHRHATGHFAARLLLLRVFGSRGRSERLLRDVGAYWRYVGSVELIAGTDLASENLEPHEFLDFVLGKLPRRFVQDNADLRRRIDQLDLLPDADGRFRVNEFFCHEDTWRETLRRLVQVTDVILVDLRGLKQNNRGVVYELHQLVELGLLDRVVALVDDTTDTGFLQATLDAAGTGKDADLRAVQVRGGRTETIKLLGYLEAAASRGMTSDSTIADLPP